LGSAKKRAVILKQIGCEKLVIEVVYENWSKETPDRILLNAAR